MTEILIDICSAASRADTMAMKGFPNQVADLVKLAQGLRCIVDLLDQQQNPRDDGVLGEALVKASIIGTGHTPKPIEEYLTAQRLKTPDRQSLRTSARGLRELFRLLGLIEDTDGAVTVTAEGRQAAAFAGSPLDTPQLEFWRRVISNLEHEGGDASASHPYQVLLHLIAKKPGISRAKCALCLEARDDTRGELERIVRLSRLSEEKIRDKIGVSKANWDNAKKVLPRFAEQLGDVVKTGQSYLLADAPGRGADQGTSSSSRSSAVSKRTQRPTHRAGASPRPPRSSRAVTPASIGTAGLAEYKEPPVPPALDPAAAAAATRLRLARLRRHNLLVRALAARFQAGGLRLFEDPFDVLAVRGRTGILGEIKTLDGTEEDERERVRDALAQLLYYEAFVTTPVAGTAAIHKVACFEHAISPAHQRWLNGSGIATIWRSGEQFDGDALAAGILGRYLEELG